jgi:hypothetical protein
MSERSENIAVSASHVEQLVKAHRAALSAVLVLDGHDPVL